MNRSIVLAAVILGGCIMTSAFLLSRGRVAPLPDEDSFATGFPEGASGVTYVDDRQMSHLMLGLEAANVDFDADPNDSVDWIADLGEACYSFPVKGTELAKAPQWSPESGSSPPLSMPDAIRAAETVLESISGRPDRWLLTTVGVEKVPFSQYWVWLVEWEPHTKRVSAQPWIHVTIPVDFAGNVPEPVEILK